jgi:hypothetical protein
MSVRRKRLQKWLVGVLAGACVLAVVLSLLPGPATVSPGPSASGGGPLGTFVEFMDMMPRGAWLLVLFVAVGIPTTLIHELGHAATARRRLGGDVAVSVGNTTPLATLRWGRVTANINAFSKPGAVAGSASISASQATARDVLLIALAGPAASLAQFAICAPLYAMVSPGLLHDVLWMATAGGAGGFLINLVPMRLHENDTGRTIATDGRLALDALRARPSTPRARRVPAAAPALPPAPVGDDVAERALRLAANAQRSVPPPR